MLKKIKSYIIVILILIVDFAIVYIFTGGGIPCVFHKITGLYCPGCGLTRMLTSIFKLNFYQAFRYNPLMFIFLILVLVYGIIKLTIKIWLKKEITLNKYLINTLLIITIAYWIMRNIPYFEYLIPTIVN